MILAGKLASTSAVVFPVRSAFRQQQQLIENHFLTAYDAVEALRSNWLDVGVSTAAPV